MAHESKRTRDERTEEPRMTKLTEGEIETKLAEVTSWSLLNDSIQRTFNFTDFVTAMAFVNRVAEIAEQVQHHPDILVRYNKVTLTLSTHDAGGITQKDFDFALDADDVADETQPPDGDD